MPDKKNTKNYKSWEEPVVLVVEDNNVLRRVLLEQLKRLGLKGVSVNNGKEAVKAATKEHTYKLVLMDVSMPVMDGITATKLIREHEKQSQTPRVPIVAVTATDSRDQCMEVGMDDFVHKPYLLVSLRSMLSRWLAPHMVAEAIHDITSESDSPQI